MKKYLLTSGMMILLSVFTFAQEKTITYQAVAEHFSGAGFLPKKNLKDHPGILILPAWMGIDENSKESAQELANLGYNVFVADIYGVDKRPSNTAEAAEKAGYFKKNVVEYRRRIQLALDQLIKQGANPDKIVVIGYCFGGTGAIETARANMKIKGIVSFHGGLDRDQNRAITPIIAKVLILHGADDPYETETEIKNFQNEMRVAKADWQMVYYANAVHAFTDRKAGNDNSKGVAYNETADKRSWLALLQFLKEVL